VPLRREFYSSSHEFKYQTFNPQRVMVRQDQGKNFDQLPVHRGLQKLGYHWQVF